eukprot:15436751-Alexandrium_andersonii.AAC.1
MTHSQVAPGAPEVRAVGTFAEDEGSEQAPRLSCSRVKCGGMLRPDRRPEGVIPAAPALEDISG